MSDHERERLLKQVPASVVVALTIVAVTLILSLALLAYQSHDATEFYKLLGALLQAGMFLVSGGALAYSAVGARHSTRTAKDMRNGVLKDNIKQAIEETNQEGIDG